MKRLLLLLISACLVASCSKPAADEEPEVEERTQQEPIKREEVIGRIASVDEGARFVLVELFFDRAKLREGALLRSYGAAGAEARLKFSGESMGSFAVADLLTGRVAKGDGVRLMVQVDEETPFFEDSSQKQEGEGQVPEDANDSSDGEG